jgi:hypothetical protein
METPRHRLRVSHELFATTQCNHLIIETAHVCGGLLDAPAQSGVMTDLPNRSPFVMPWGSEAWSGERCILLFASLRSEADMLDARRGSNDLLRENFTIFKMKLI